MRIVGGKYKGRIFTPGKNFRSRPTTDIAKEGLFNILENRYFFDDKILLDLFSGTGSLAYEFISRGGKSAVMVEADIVHYRFIVSVLNKLKIDNVTVLKSDAFQFLKKYKGGTFDFILADPPYGLQRLSTIPDAVFSSGLLANNGLFILEHPKEFNFATHPYFQEIRRYGKVHFSFFTKDHS
ncbi:MAG: 16S rRNA (guanine(966)-N(2))-methyltransferase RsmD [Draconibacterium sp.]|nr:MAG: 16S rRNA (guanine(966)-N(2))-methyltransferase RsmD [Draconibacterium sp.]